MSWLNLFPASHHTISDVVTNIWDATGHLMTEGSVKCPSGGVQYTFQLERLPEKLSNSLSLHELWEKIQLSHGRTLVLSFVPRRPKHLENLPELLNDAHGQHKKWNENEPQSSACYSKANDSTHQRLFSDFMLQPGDQSSNSSQKALCGSPLEGWTIHQFDTCLGSVPYLSSRDCMPWTSARAQSVGYGYHSSYLHSQNHAHPPPTGVCISASRELTCNTANKSSTRQQTRIQHLFNYAQCQSPPVSWN
jgi:hypothetical protein